MENEARYILAGSLIVAVSLLMLASLVWLAGGSRIAYAHYTIYFRNQSMDGLDINSPVKLRGIKVGEVSSYAFVPGSQDAVRVQIRINPATPIHADSRAVVDRNIVTGLAAIEITNPPSNSPLVKSTQEPPWPVIAEGSSDLEKVTTNVTQMSVKTARMLDSVNQVLSPANIDAISATLANLQKVTAALSDDRKQMGATLQSVRQAADSLNRAADSLDATSRDFDSGFASLGAQTKLSLQQSADALVTVKQQSVILSGRLQALMNTVTDRLNETASDLQQSQARFGETARRLNQPGSLIFGTGRGQPAPGE